MPHTQPPLAGAIVPGSVNRAANNIRACAPGRATAEDLHIVATFQRWLAGDRSVWNDHGHPVDSSDPARA